MDISMKSLLRDRLVEFIKYDFNNFKYPLVLIARIAVWGLIRVNKNDLAFKIASNVYRTGWRGSYALGRDVSRYFFKSTKKGEMLVANALKDIAPLSQTKKFFADPSAMLNGVIVVLKSPDGEEKGAILINYSYYFLLFLKFYDVAEISKKYNIILEPSWAGFCELDILAYGVLPSPIFLMVYEGRDRRFINDLGLSIIPLDIGPSWFVNHNKFLAPKADAVRDIDIIMVASWAKFKRHHQFFKALAALKRQGKSLKVALVGYPVDMKQEDIRGLARLHDVEGLIMIYEWIKPAEVAELLRRAKINIVWSKFEGNNRAIIEGMFCDTPAILREGHNYGEKYDFINAATGNFANEQNLPEIIFSMLREHGKYSPREYVMENRNCISATTVMNDVIRGAEIDAGRPWNQELAVKVNELHGMDYLFDEDKSRFSRDYEELAKYVK